MAENKTKPTAISVPAFLDACTDEARRTDAKVLAKLMKKVTGIEPAMWGPSIVGFSPRKAANVLYGTIGFDGADALLAKLGNHTTGKGCLYIKKLADVDIKVLETLSRRPLQQRGRDTENKRSLVIVRSRPIVGDPEAIWLRLVQPLNRSAWVCHVVGNSAGHWKRSEAVASKHP